MTKTPAEVEKMATSGALLASVLRFSTVRRWRA